MALLGNVTQSTYPTNTGGRTSDYNKLMSTAKDIRNQTLGNKSVATMAYEKNAKPDLPDRPSYTGGGGGSKANEVLGATSLGDDIIGKIRSLLEEQNKSANASAEAWYNQLMNQIKGTSRADLDLSNRQYKMDERRYRELHGKDPNSGSGFSNMARITQNWRDRNNAIRMNEEDNSATALANYQSALANNASTLAQGWSNYILPYYVNQANRNA